MRKFITAIAATLMAAYMAAPAMAEDMTIKMGTMGWEDLTPITGITKKVLEDAGYKVDTQIMVSQTDYVAHDY